MSTRDADTEQRSRLTARQEMKRITVRMPEGMDDAIAELDENGEFASKSAVVRDAVRHYLKEDRDR